MEDVRWRGMRISRLTLGTVQLGMPYGVANRTGQPSQRDATSIIAAALERGIHCFDTAAAYGNSEEVLGNALAELQVAETVVVVTKVRALTDEERSSSDLARRAIEVSVEQSRKRLQIDRLPIVLFHREDDAAFLPELAELRSRGWIQHIGISGDHDPASVRKRTTGDHAEAVQLPANLLDRRHLDGSLLTEFQQQDVAVFIRSLFLQGLLLMPEDQIPESLKSVVPVRRSLEALAQEAGIAMLELAIRYLLSFPVTSLVVGAERPEQIQANVVAVEKGPLDTELQDRLNQVTINLPERTITPRLWSS
ncbi:MAG: aldo/keto reductase [Planctomycetaceae bacterium]|nr:aldo/keto reductase [Planctomycetaceae bacterium]MCA9078954.1 aldo/keto reductase [Planctomycetaceae bacterium]